ncbi:hypothetical protein BWQ96_06985 [Gracilariopsis chorda]|uniref:Uncharacterized protein n=1 Tax=Gracilariopsis chorda TaxID=448386 RepID=A0A2V3IMF3_9FLOR|nr:hypothetical protein BWQ96_06985 [Gracilariopsis chorda]|eukprot:PXF43258.1 hypothetical protein BWQ96_06985 [Gracilariopsis chorda]
MSDHGSTQKNGGKKSKSSNARNTNVQIGDWLLLKNGTLTASKLLRETWRNYNESSDDRQITIACKLTGTEHQREIVVSSNILKMLAPQLIPPETAGNTTILQTRSGMIDVIDNFIHARDVDISRFPPRFLVYSAEYNLRILYYAHLEYIVNKACDRNTDLPAFLNEYTEVLQVLGEYLPLPFLAHVGRRIITDFDERTCSKENVPLLWSKGKFRSRSGGNARYHRSLWRLLDAVGVVELMFHYASGLHLNTLGPLLNFMIVYCVNERSLESENEHETELNCPYLRMFQSIDWSRQRQAVPAVLRYSVEWPTSLRTALRESINQAQAELRRTDVQYEDVKMWIQIPSKRRARKTLSIATYEMFDGFVGRVEIGVENECLFLELSMWPADVANQRLWMGWSLEVSVSVFGVEAFCTCDSSSTARNYKRYNWPVISPRAASDAEDQVQFTEDRKRFRKPLLEALEDQWFDVHSMDCWLIGNVRISKRS